MYKLILSKNEYITQTHRKYFKIALNYCLENGGGKMNLECIYDSRQSFYGKAKIEFQKNDYESVKDLYSYGTLVASIIVEYENRLTIYKYFGKFSQTTTRHQKEFFKQHNLSDKEIVELFKNGELIKEW